MEKIRAGSMGELGWPEAHALLGLDFDGTLAPIARRPELARIPERTRRLLMRFARSPRAIVAIASGRGLADIRAKMRVPGLYYVGNHGLEIQDPAGALWVHPQARALAKRIKRVAVDLARELSALPGVFVEDKGLSLAVHYRAMPRWLSSRPIHEIVAERLSAEPKLRLTAGKKVWEIRPKLRWNKGYALKRILRLRPGWSVAFIGDDATDEEGFETLGVSALTVRVGRARDSAARFSLTYQRQVHGFLEYLYRKWK